MKRLAAGLFVLGVSAGVRADGPAGRAREACVMGWTYYYDSRLDKARAMWQQALEWSPRLEEARRGLAQLQHEALILPPEQAFAGALREHYDRGMACSRRRRFQEAREWLEKALALAPSHPRLREALAETRSAMGEAEPPPAPAAAPPAALPAPAPRTPPPAPAPRPAPVKRPPPPARLSAAEIEGWYRQGYKAYRQGRREEAARIWRLVLQADPGHVRARMNLEQMARQAAARSRR